MKSVTAHSSVSPVTRPQEIPATCFLIGTPAAISDRVDAQTEACEVEPLDSKVDHKRPDGRAIDQIRPLAAEIDIIPRVHGSGMFTRGQTQICNVCTLAPLAEAQRIDGLDEGEYRFLHLLRRNDFFHFLKQLGRNCAALVGMLRFSAFRRHLFDKGDNCLAGKCGGIHALRRYNGAFYGHCLEGAEGGDRFLPAERFHYPYSITLAAKKIQFFLCLLSPCSSRVRIKKLLFIPLTSS